MTMTFGTRSASFEAAPVAKTNRRYTITYARESSRPDCCCCLLCSIARSGLHLSPSPPPPLADRTAFLPSFPSCPPQNCIKLEPGTMSSLSSLPFFTLVNNLFKKLESQLVTIFYFFFILGFMKTFRKLAGLRNTKAFI